MSCLRLSVAPSIAALLCCAVAGAQDPTKEEVPLAAADGWYARLVYESDAGIWTVRAVDVIERFGCPEIVGLDDRGRCTILWSYSGKWTPYQTVEDGAWLGALAHDDVDPNIPGPELYTGGKNGNLYQIVAHPRGGFDTRILARFGDNELHTFACGDLLPSRPGIELLAFTRMGEVYDICPGPSPREPWMTPQIAQLPGRVRDLVLLPAAPGERPQIAAVSRAKEVMLLSMTPDGGLEREVILHEPMGFGRISLKRSGPGEPCVLYVTRDDGVILRLERSADREWRRELIYAGPQGARGVASGRFDADPEVETVAVFGYSGKVQILSRRPGEPFRVETVFTDVDKGHWLEAAELDGRNATDELIGSGYGKRIFLIGRPPGYGLVGVPVDDAGPDR